MNYKYMKENNMKEIKTFYRYEVDNQSVSYDEDEIYSKRFIRSKLTCKVYYLHKETPKGYWIGIGQPPKPGELSSSWRKWIPKESKKRYAYPTREEAIINFIKRTKRRMNILESQVGSCKVGLKAADKEYRRIVNQDLV